MNKEDIFNTFIKEMEALTIECETQPISKE